MRERILMLTPLGAIGGVFASALGGWDTALQVLVLFMLADYVTGLILAAVFKKSSKTECGALSSAVGLKGFIKKFMMLVFVAMGYAMDLLLGWEFVRYGVIIAFIVNETISIVENAGLMGVPVPPVIKQAIDILKKKEGSDDD